MTYLVSDRGRPGLRLIVGLSSFAMLFVIAFTCFIHIDTADALSKGCPGGGCEGFPPTAWAGTRSILLTWIGINALIGGMLVVFLRFATSGESKPEARD